jgi:hypothetical protein
LSKRQGQPDCFYEKSLILFKGHSDNASLDSVKRICTVWESVNPNPCLATSTYTQFLADHYTSENQVLFCEAAHRTFSSCPGSTTSLRSKQLAILCPTFSCSSIDSLLDKAFPLDLMETKKTISLLAQRGCTQGKTYEKLNQSLLDQEPSFNSLYHRAENDRETGKLNDAYHYYSKAEKIARSKEERSLCYLGIAKTLERQKNWAGAKDFATMAAETDAQNPESFVLLAQVLLVAEKECSFSSQEEKCALYLLVAQAYKCAKKTKEASNYFQKSSLGHLVPQTSPPSKIKLGCFINEEVELKK